MTRGKMIFIDGNKRMHVSCEFNGDMYLSWYGKLVIANLDMITTKEEFESFVRYFDGMFFKYQENEDGYYGIFEKKIKDNLINVCDDYFDNWFSDYLYFKNASGEDITFKYRNNRYYTLKSGEIAVFNYDELYDYKEELKQIIGKEGK